MKRINTSFVVLLAGRDIPNTYSCLITVFHSTRVVALNISEKSLDKDWNS